MEKKKRDILLLLLLVGVLAFYLVYQFFFLKVQTQIESVEAENEGLQTKISGLQALLPNEDKYNEEIETMTADMAEITSKFPADSRLEDSYLFAINLSDQSGMTYSSISVGAKEPFYQPGATDAESATGTAPAATEAAAADASPVGADTGMIMYKIPVGFGIQTTYDGLKKAIDYICTQEERKTIESLSVSFDNSTGNLSGTMSVNIFTLTGTNNTYEEPNIPTDIPTGTGNIFGTIEIPAQIIQ